MIRRAVIDRTLRTLPGYNLAPGDLVSDEDVPIYCKAGTRGYYDTDDGFFKSDDGAEFYPPEWAVRYL